jgi:hypothetical protein
MVGGILFPNRTKKMPKMCAFDSGSVGPLFVDPTQVRMVKSINPSQTLLEFSNDRTWTIDLPIEEVRRLLDAALSSD